MCKLWSCEHVCVCLHAYFCLCVNEGGWEGGRERPPARANYRKWLCSERRWRCVKQSRSLERGGGEASRACWLSSSRPNPSWGITALFPSGPVRIPLGVRTPSLILLKLIWAYLPLATKSTVNEVNAYAVTHSVSRIALFVYPLSIFVISMYQLYVYLINIYL